MFESGSYKSLPEHIALYEALEASMKHANRDEFLAEKDKEAPSSSSKQKSIPYSKQPVEDVSIPDDMNISDLEDTNTAHLRKIRTIPDWLKPVPEEERPATPEPEWLLRHTGDMSSFINWFCKWIGKKKLSKADLEGPTFKLLHDMSKPLLLEVLQTLGLIESALSISKLKASQYLDFGLEELVPSLWIESERDYDISAAYEIVLHKADYNEYKISEADFKNMHLNDFEDLYLLHLQEDYTIVSKPRAVIYRDRNDQKKMMRETEVHKFSDGTLNRILDKLDHMVKDFKLFKYNPGMEIRIWSEDDRRRSKEFMENIRVIPKYHSEDGNPARANIKQALGRSDTYTGNPVKEVLLKLNLPDHSKDGDGDTSFQWS
ncbi:hypothetical protein Tco_0443016 [Tanacetum coccineum]